MNSGLVEARELAARIARIQQEGAARSLLEAFATETQETWQSLLGPGHVRALPDADPWVRQNAARILACTPASGNDLDALLGQIGLRLDSHEAR
jgi:hypothetical protein